MFGARYLPATDAARIILIAAAIQLWVGWAKSFPVSIGRPGLRLLTSGIETALLFPLVLVLGLHWGATGAAIAMLASSLAYAVCWAYLYLRIHREPGRRRARSRRSRVSRLSGAWTTGRARSGAVLG